MLKRKKKFSSRQLSRKRAQLKAQKMLYISRQLAFEIGVKMSEDILSDKKPQLIEAGEESLFCIQSQELDNYFDILHAKMNIQPSCIDGCSGCCKYPIWVSVIEKKVILNYINNNLCIGELKENINKWKTQIGELAKNLRPRTIALRGQYIKKNVKCPFLKENHCLIYPVRPIACRVYFSYGIPADCEEKAYPKGTVSYECALHNIYIAPLYNVTKKVGNSDKCKQKRMKEEFFYPETLLPFIFDFQL